MEKIKKKLVEQVSDVVRHDGGGDSFSKCLTNFDQFLPLHLGANCTCSSSLSKIYHVPFNFCNAAEYDTDRNS